MTPPQLHMHFDALFSAGAVPRITVGEPGTQGAAVTGMHGMGVRTPMAAAVAAATIGFEGDWHIPNGGMFSMGLLSMMLAAGGPPPSTLFIGSTTSADGATPNVHCKLAPVTTSCPMSILYFLTVVAVVAAVLTFMASRASFTAEPFFSFSVGKTSTQVTDLSLSLFQLSNEGNR